MNPNQRNPHEEQAEAFRKQQQDAMGAFFGAAGGLMGATMGMGAGAGQSSSQDAFAAHQQAQMNAFGGMLGGFGGLMNAAAAMPQPTPEQVQQYQQRKQFEQQQKALENQERELKLKEQQLQFQQQQAAQAAAFNQQQQQQPAMGINMTIGGGPAAANMHPGPPVFAAGASGAAAPAPGIFAAAGGAPSGMPPAAFSALLTSIKKASFAKDKLNVLSLAAATNTFTGAQAKEIVSIMPFSSDKIDAGKLLFPRVTDGQFFLVFDALSFSSDKEKLKNALGL